MRKWLWLPLVWGLAFLGAAPVRAEMLPVKLSGDEVHYDADQQQIQASGHVKINYKNFRVESDQAIVDKNEDILLALGNVRVFKDKEEFSGDRFLFYIKLQQGWLQPMNAEIIGDEIKGKLFLTASDAFIKGEDIRLKKSGFTSCDLAVPHFHFTAAEIEYFPGDRIIFHKMWYWEGKVRLMYLPYLAISLKDDSNNFEVRLGQTTETGWDLFVGYNYYVNSDSYGKVYTDITQKTGDDIGIIHYINSSPTSRWYQDYCIRDLLNPDIKPDDFKYAFGYQQWTSPKHDKLEFESTIENWHHYTDYQDCYLDGKYHFYYYGVSPNPTLLYLTFDGTGTPNETTRFTDFSRNLELGGQWNFSPNPSLNYSANLRWFKTDWLQSYLDSNQNTVAYDTKQNDIDYTLKAYKNWGWSNLQATYYEKNVFSGADASNNLKPDLLYNIPKFSLPFLGLFSLQSEYTNLEKVDSTEVIGEGQRFAFDLNKNKIDLWKDPLGTWGIYTTASERYRDLDYSEDDTLTKEHALAITGTIGATDHLTKTLSTDVNLNLSQVEGDHISSDFFGWDSLEPGMEIKNSWNWASGPWHSTFDSGYVFYTKTPDPANIMMSYNSKSGTSATINSTYYWNQGLGNTNFQFNYHPKKDWNLAASMAYDFRYSQMYDLEFRAEIKDKISKNWRYELKAYYDPIRNAFSTEVFDFIYDWHCRELLFHFDLVQREFWFQVNIKAFPAAKFRFSRDPMEFWQQ